MKINLICFVLLLFLLVGVSSAADSDNETLQYRDVSSQGDDLSVDTNDDSNVLKKSIESDNTDSVCLKNLEINNTNQVVAKTVNIDNKLESTNKTTTKIIIPYLIEKIKVKLFAPNVKMHYNDGSKFKITLKDAKNKLLTKTKVNIQINGKTYTQITDNKGVASLSLNLKSGTYKVITTFLGSKYYYNRSITSNVEVKSTIKCGDFTKFYKNNLAYSSTFYDSKGKVLKNTAIKFNLNKRTYSVKTDVNGVAKLSVDLKPGLYNISVINTKTSESITKTVTIKNLIQTKDVTVTAKDGSKYSVKLYKSNGKAASFTKFKVNLNGKVYYEKTDKNGIGTIKLNLNAGKYSIAIQYNGITNINKIMVNKIKSVLDYLNPFKKATLKSSEKLSKSNIIQNDFNNKNPYLVNNWDSLIQNQMNSKLTIVS